MAEALGEMKGLAMKVGQQSSYLRSDVSDEWQEALARLQQDALPMGPAAVSRVVREELGAPPDEVFAEWDPAPIGAASIGQVHRAVTRDGRPVAVKVQYPGAADALDADMDTLSSFMQTLMRRGHRHPDAPPEGFIASAFDQFKLRLVQETDYRREAANQELIGAAFEGHPLVHVPRVVREHSTARVLTTDLAEGARFAEVVAWDRRERDLAGETLFRFHHECLFRVGHHNADPHPGNYLFRPGGQVSFLDFGAIWEVPVAFYEGLPRLLALLVSEDDPPFTLRWLRDQVVAEGERKLPPPSQPVRPRAADDEDAVFLREMAKTIGTSTPAFDGVQAVLAALGAVRDWGAIARDIMAGSPRCAATEAPGTL